jgi:hypothetical protein
MTSDLLRGSCLAMVEPAARALAANHRARRTPITATDDSAHSEPPVDRLKCKNVAAVYTTGGGRRKGYRRPLPTSTIGADARIRTDIPLSVGVFVSLRSGRSMMPFKHRVAGFDSPARSHRKVRKWSSHKGREKIRATTSRWTPETARVRWRRRFTEAAAFSYLSNPFRVGNKLPSWLRGLGASGEAGVPRAADSENPLQPLRESRNNGYPAASEPKARSRSFVRGTPQGRHPHPARLSSRPILIAHREPHRRGSFLRARRGGIDIDHPLGGRAGRT